MRVLMVAEDAEERAARARDLATGGALEVCGACEPTQVTARVRATCPEALVIASDGPTSALRLILGRARGAAEAPLPAVLLLAPSSLWLHTALPGDLSPASALPSTADAARIAAALGALASGAPVASSTRLGDVVFERSARRLVGAAGEVSLTPSETAVLALLAAEPGAFVATEVIALALWGAALVDRHARGAIRSHVHTLRGKLSAAGFLGVVEARIAAGYRLSLEPGA